MLLTKSIKTDLKLQTSEQVTEKPELTACAVAKYFTDNSVLMLGGFW